MVLSSGNFWALSNQLPLIFRDAAIEGPVERVKVGRERLTARIWL
jgi:hypothetical protein